MKTRKAIMCTALVSIAAFGALAGEASARPGAGPAPRITPAFNKAVTGVPPRAAPAKPSPSTVPRGQGARPTQVFNGKAGQTSTRTTAVPRRTAGTPQTPHPRVWIGWQALKAKLMPPRSGGTQSIKPAFSGAGASSLTLSHRKAAQGPMVSRPTSSQHNHDFNPPH